jgi:GWxTD domain-containing protein
MTVKRSVLLAALAALVLAPFAAAEKLSKESKKWLEEDVAPIIVPSEEKVFKDLKESDRLEFQKIFWSRRDPSNDTPKPENEFKADYLKKKADADQKFRAPGRQGAATDCGRTFILLGEPESKQSGARGEGALGGRAPETWTYKDKPGLPIRIKSGQLVVDFDEQCMFAEGRGLRDQLVRLAEGKIVRPGLEYRFAKDGRLVKLVDLLPKPSQAQLLLKEPRQDFPLAADVQFLKTSDGGTALVGVVHGKAEALTLVDAGGRKAAKVTVAAQAIDEAGRVATIYEQATLAPIAADGTFSASYRLGLQPGKYTLRVAALDEAAKKGSVVEKKATEVPDLNTGELSAASLIPVRDIEEKVDGNDPAHPYSAYLLGAARLVPYAAEPLSKSDTLSVFYQYYDAKADATTGKANVVASLQIVKGDKPVARAADAPFDVAMVGGTVVGPVPLDKYEPGVYTVKLKVVDNLSKRELTRELVFEVK